VARRLSAIRACARIGCERTFRLWARSQRFCSQRCGAFARQAGHERSKRACHKEARQHLKDRCEGILRSGRACNRVRGLHVHHRDSDYRNNAEENLQTLCRGCHVRAHGKKTWRENNRRLAA
jgi:HNH endonuclease